MTVANPSCPKCSIGLHEGFLLEQSRNFRGVTEWVEGKPEKSFWTGIALQGKTRLKVETYRCPRCGFLELYAPGGDSR